MNIFIPNYKEAFRVKQEGKLTIRTPWRFRRTKDGKDHDEIKVISKNDVELTVLEDTIMEITAIRVRRSEYRNFITFLLHHDAYTGIQYKTVGKIKIDLFEDNNGFRQLDKLDVEIIE